MNVELLAKMIGQLVLDHDRVSLPGVGTFFAEMMPASFSDRGFSINPPYKTLSFNQMHTDDDLLVTLYAKSNDLDIDVARPYIVQFLQELKLVLLEKKTIILPGLGRLRTTRENNFFFVCDENLDIFPEGFALKPVSLKSLSSIEIEPVNIQVPLPPTPGSVAPPVTEPAPEPAVIDEASIGVSESDMLQPEPDAHQPEEPIAQESVPDETQSEEPTLPQLEPVQEVAESPAPRKKFRWWVLILVVFALAVIALASFLVLAHVAPDFIDSLLYTPEELRIIYY